MQYTKLTHFMPLVSFCNPWKHQKAGGFRNMSFILIQYIVEMRSKMQKWIEAFYFFLVYSTHLQFSVFLVTMFSPGSGQCSYFISLENPKKPLLFRCFFFGGGGGGVQNGNFCQKWVNLFLSLFIHWNHFYSFQPLQYQWKFAY